MASRFFNGSEKNDLGIARLMIFIAWLITAIPLVLPMSWLVEHHRVPTFNDFKLILYIDLIMTAVGFCVLYLFSEDLLKQSRKATEQEIFSSLRTYEHSKATEAKDLETIRKVDRELLRAIQSSQKAATDCLATTSITGIAEKELAGEEHETFIEYDFWNKAKNAVIFQTRATRDFVQKLMAGQRTTEVKLVHLLEKLLAAETACNICNGEQEDSECQAMKILSQIDM